MPTLTARIAATSASSTCAARSFATYTRVAAVQSWPVFIVAAKAALPAISSTSASSKTMNGALPDAGLGRQLGQHQRGQRRGRRGLEHDGAAGRQRRADLPDRHHQRVVPWRDLADHAD